MGDDAFTTKDLKRTCGNDNGGEAGMHELASRSEVIDQWFACRYDLAPRPFAQVTLLVMQLTWARGDYGTDSTRKPRRHVWSTTKRVLTHSSRGK